MSEVSSKERAEELHQEAMALSDAGEDDLALKKYFETLELDFLRPTTHYNIGLIYKYRRQWPESFRYNKRATELDPTDEASNWNLAIAATALRDWKTARHIWHGLGMPIEEGENLIEANFGVTPVRLNPDEDGEVVWSRRIDPVRARLTSIPFPGSGFCYGDIVLHDGAPVGYREYEGREYAVFNVLEVFEHSAYSTFEVELHGVTPEDIQSLQSICHELGVECEDWTTSVRNICRQCSEGRPHEHYDHDKQEEWKDRHVAGLAAITEKVARDAIDRWQNDVRGVERFELALSAREISDQ